MVTGHVRLDDETRSNAGESSSAGQRNRVEERRAEMEDDDDEEEEGWLGKAIAAVRGRAAKQKVGLVRPGHVTTTRETAESWLC